MKLEKENINNKSKNCNKIKDQIDIFGDFETKKLYSPNTTIALKNK